MSVEGDNELYLYLDWPAVQEVRKSTKVILRLEVKLWVVADGGGWYKEANLRDGVIESVHK